MKTSRDMTSVDGVGITRTVITVARVASGTSGTPANDSCNIRGVSRNLFDRHQGRHGLDQILGIVVVCRSLNDIGYCGKEETPDDVAPGKGICQCERGPARNRGAERNTSSAASSTLSLLICDQGNDPSLARSSTLACSCAIKAMTPIWAYHLPPHHSQRSSWTSAAAHGQLPRMDIAASSYRYSTEIAHQIGRLAYALRKHLCRHQAKSLALLARTI